MTIAREDTPLRGQDVVAVAILDPMGRGAELADGATPDVEKVGRVEVGGVLEGNDEIVDSGVDAVLAGLAD